MVRLIDSATFRHIEPPSTEILVSLNGLDFA